MNKLILLFLLTLICGCSQEYTNEDYIKETKRREFETNPSSFNISQLQLVCTEATIDYKCLRWEVQPK